MFGLTVSILTVSFVVLLLLTLSVAVHATGCVPSPDTESVPEYESAFAVKSGVGDRTTGARSTKHASVFSPLPASDAVTFTVTGDVLFHPFEPFAVWVTERDGLVLSTTRSNIRGSASLPALSLAVTLIV